MTRLEVKPATNNPIYTGDKFYYKAAFFEDDGTLLEVQTDINLSWEILSGAGNVTIYPPTAFISTRQDGSYWIRFFFNGVYFDFYFCSTPRLDIGIGPQDIYSILKQEQPPLVYTQSTNAETSGKFVDEMASAQTIDLFYQDLVSFADLPFPQLLDSYSAGYLQQWEEAIVGDFAIYSSTDARTPTLLQFLMTLRFSLNPYDLAYAVTQYIYLRMGLQVYVYIEEFLNIYTPGQWILGASTLGTNTLLGSGISPRDEGTFIVHILNTADPIPEEVQSEISGLVAKITIAGARYTIIYGEDPASLNLVEPLDSTYKGDPRTVGVYCLQYDPNAYDNVIGLTNPYTVRNLLSIASAPTGVTVDVDVDVAFNTTAFYKNGWSQDVTYQANYVGQTPDTLEPTLQNNIFHTLDVGTGVILVTYYDKVFTINITVGTPGSAWILGVSTLGDNTEL